LSLPGFPDAAPLPGSIGGVLIGLAAALMLLGGMLLVRLVEGKG